MCRLTRCWPAPPGVLAVRNTAEALDDGSSGIELDPSNQSAGDATTVAGPDLAVTGIRLVSRSALQATIAVTLANHGKEATLGPDSTSWFGVDLYVKQPGDPPPFGPGDRYLGACPTPTHYCPGDIRWALYKYLGGGLAAGASTVVTYTHDLPAHGAYWLYAQADPAWGDGKPASGSAAHGRIFEGDEDNNIFGPFVIDLSDYRVFLPAVLKNP